MAGLTRLELTNLVLSLAQGKPLSPVQLQKAIFLLQERIPGLVIDEEKFEFTAHNYGPFCKEIYSSVKQLSDRGLAFDSPLGNDRYDSYWSTVEGSATAQEVKSRLDASQIAYAQKLVGWVKDQSFRNLVSAIYKHYPQYKVNSIFSD